MRKILLAVLLLCGAHANCGCADSPSVTVCQVLQGLDHFCCRAVRIKAKVESSVDTYLVGESCPQKVKVGDVVFPDLIAVQWPGDPLVSCKLTFGLNKVCLNRFREALRHYEPQKQTIEVVIDGVIETRNPLNGLALWTGQRMGFGHLGSAPAQIIVERIVSLKVAPKSARAK